MRSYRDNLDKPIGTSLPDRPLPPIPPAHLRSRCRGGDGGGTNGNDAGVFRMVWSKRKKKPLDQWPPAELALPDTIEEIERGRRIEHQELFQEPPDDSREGRLRRLLATGRAEFWRSEQ